MTNVLLIVCDALRARNLREYGYHRDTAPFITELCDSATVYRNAYSHLNYTTPSIATMLTGEYHQKTGIWRLYYPKYDEPEDKPSMGFFYDMPKWKWKLHAPTIMEKLNPTHRTIMINEVLVDLTDQGAVIWKDFDVAPSNYSGQKGKQIHPQSNIPVHPTAEQTTAAAMYQMDEALSNKEKFFMYVHYWDTHWPLSTPEKEAEKFYDGTNPKSLHELYGGKITPDARRMLREQIAARTEKRDLNHLIAWYDSEIYAMDKGIQQLVDSAPEDTLVIITADHGEGMGEHNQVYFGHTECWLYNEVLHVPLIVKFPDNSKDLYRRTIYDRVENRKVYNIIENYVLKGRNDDPIESEYIYAFSKMSEDFSPHIDVLIKDNLKLFVYEFGKEVFGFNLNDDPEEKNPLLVNDRPEFDELKNLIMPLVEAEMPKPEGGV